MNWPPPSVSVDLWISFPPVHQFHYSPRFRWLHIFYCLYHIVLYIFTWSHTLNQGLQSWIDIFSTQVDLSHLGKNIFIFFYESFLNNNTIAQKSFSYTFFLPPHKIFVIPKLNQYLPNLIWELSSCLNNTNNAIYANHVFILFCHGYQLIISVNCIHTCMYLI